MTKKEIINSHEVYTIISSDGQTRASFIPQKGAIGSSIIVTHNKKERELLFLHDFFWEKQWSDLPGGWPFLFPVCARVERNGQAENYLYEGHIYQMPMHGFAWQLPWEVVDATKPDELIMRLRDNATTRIAYPFSFEVKLHYKVGYGMLVCEQTYTNFSDQPMLYYAGFHPYFATPMPGQGKENVLLDYKPVKQFQYNEKYTDLIGEQKLFHLPASIMQPNLNEQLTKVGEDKLVKLIYPDSFTLNIKAEGVEDIDLFSYIQLYTIPNKSFFCVEPWMAFPNAINTVVGVRWLNPGQTEHGIQTLSTEFLAADQ